MKAVVVGGGAGGLCTAIRLRAAGHDVTLLERNPVVGGKLAALREAGYTFDLGPTLFTMPHLYDEVFRLAGRMIGDELELVRLDPQFHYRWPNGSELDVPDDRTRTADAVDALSPGAGAAWTRFAEHAREIWDVAERTFLAGPVSSPWSLAKRSRNPLDLRRVDGARTLAKLAAASFASTAATETMSPRPFR